MTDSCASAPQSQHEQQSLAWIRSCFVLVAIHPTLKIKLDCNENLEPGLHASCVFCDTPSYPSGPFTHDNLYDVVIKFYRI
jgi:hypothetical protein